MGTETRYCISCRHFRNSSRYLESAYKAFTSIGSAHVSVSRDDGICLKREMYLSASGFCKHYVAR